MSSAAAETIRNMADGAHVSCIYNDQDEHIRVCSSLVSSGLGAGQKVLCVGEPATVVVLKEYLSEAGIDIQSLGSSGKVELYSEQLTEGSTAGREPGALVELIANRTRQALAEGFHGLSVWVEMAFAAWDPHDTKNVLDYEDRLSRFLAGGSNCLVLCAYDRGQFAPEVIRNVLNTHPVVIIGTEAFDNFYYISPDTVRSHEPAASEVHAWIENLRVRGNVATGGGHQKDSVSTENEAASEFSRLGAYADGSAAPVTGAMYGQRSLRLGCSDEFEDLRQSYETILTDSIEERTYNAEYQISSRLQTIAQCLAGFDAGPRDVVEIHVAALRRVTAGTPNKRAGVIHNEARLIALELMGYLVSEYRNRVPRYDGGER